MTNRILAACFAIAIAAAAVPARAGAPEKDPGALAMEGVGKLVRALELLLDNIPQYEKPEITEQGDIIIRRKRPNATELPGQPQPQRNIS